MLRSGSICLRCSGGEEGVSAEADREPLKSLEVSEMKGANHRAPPRCASNPDRDATESALGRSWQEMRPAKASVDRVASDCRISRLAAIGRGGVVGAAGRAASGVSMRGSSSCMDDPSRSVDSGFEGQPRRAAVVPRLSLRAPCHGGSLQGEIVRPQADFMRPGARRSRGIAAPMAAVPRRVPALPSGPVAQPPLRASDCPQATRRRPSTAFSHRSSECEVKGLVRLGG